MLRQLKFVCVLSLAACTGEKKSEPAAEPPPIKKAAVDEPAAPAEPPAESEVASMGQHFVTIMTSMRKQPTGDRKIPSEKDPNKKVSNWVTTLHSGELVDVLSHDGDWSLAKASDDSTGFVQTKLLLSAEESEPFTVLGETQVFRRPDLLTLNSSRKIEPATLLFKLEERDQFTKVKNGYREDWILTDKIVNDENEVKATTLLVKARWMKNKKDEGFDSLMNLIKTQFEDAKVVELALEKFEEQDEAEEAKKEAAEKEQEDG